MHKIPVFPSNWTSPLRYNIVEAAKRQKHFFLNDSNDYFNSEEAVVRGTKRYCGFLERLRENPGASQAHSYDINFVWNAHTLANTKKYSGETKRLVGRFVNRKEKDVRNSGVEWDMEFKKSVELWNELAMMG